MSPTLKAFYGAYAAWLDAGAPEGKPFKRRYGLCYNLECHFVMPLSAVEPTRREMQAQLREAGLSAIYPFGGESRYDAGYHRACQHLNRKRIAWVREHAA